MGVFQQMLFLISFDSKEHALASQCDRNDNMLSAFTYCLSVGAACVYCELSLP